MADKNLNRNFFQRIFGICATKPPADENCWSYSEGEIRLNMSKSPELNEKYGAVRLEGDEIPERVLVMKGDNGQFYAFHNHCTHGGRRLDPVPGTETVQCCSVGKSTFDYNGKVLKGSTTENIKTYPVKLENGTLLISLTAE